MKKILARQLILKNIHAMALKKIHTRNLVTKNKTCGSKNQRMYRLINVFATLQFRSFQWLLSALLLLAKSWRLQELFKLIDFLTFEFNLCIR